MQKTSASSSERSLAAQNEALNKLRIETQNHSALAASTTPTARTMSQQARWLTDSLAPAASMLGRGLRLNRGAYRAVLSIQESLGHSMRRTLIQSQIALGNPLRRIAPVHLQSTTSRKMLHLVRMLLFPEVVLLDSLVCLMHEKKVGRARNGVRYTTDDVSRLCGELGHRSRFVLKRKLRDPTCS